MVGENDADHRPHEQQQQREKPAGRIILRQIVAGVEDDQQADPQDQQDEQAGKTVQAQDEVKTGLRQPRPADRQRRPGKGRQQRPYRQQQGQRRDTGRRPGRRSAAQSPGERRQQSAGKGQQHYEQQIHGQVNPSR